MNVEATADFSQGDGCVCSCHCTVKHGGRSVFEHRLTPPPATLRHVGASELPTVKSSSSSSYPPDHISQLTKASLNWKKERFYSLTPFCFKIELFFCRENNALYLSHLQPEIIPHDSG